MEGKGCHIAKGSCLLSLVLGTNALGSILNKQNTALLAKGCDLVHGSHIAIEVDHHDGLCLRGHGLCNGLGRNHMGAKIHVTPAKTSPLLQIGVGGGCKGVRGHDHFVALLEAAQLGAELKGGGTVHHGKAASFLHTLVGRKGLFEFLQVFALGQGLCVTHDLCHKGYFFFCIADGTSAEIDAQIHFENSGARRDVPFAP